MALATPPPWWALVGAGGPGPLAAAGRQCEHGPGPPATGDQEEDDQRPGRDLGGEGPGEYTEAV